MPQNHALHLVPALLLALCATACAPSTPATDLYMAALTMVRLLGGDVGTKALPPTCPPRLRAFLRSCLIEAPARRPQHAWDLFDEFQALLKRLFSKPTFRPFMMPEVA